MVGRAAGTVVALLLLGWCVYHTAAAQPPAGEMQPPAGDSQPPAGDTQPPASKTQPATNARVPLAIVIDTGRTLDGAFTLVGQDARQQLVVTAHCAGGVQTDLTAAVSYESTPAGVVSVDRSGIVTPLKDGRATITARTAVGPAAKGPATAGLASEVQVEVIHFGQEAPINFANEIVPLFTRLGCNGGGCHGKASGQNGFRLSLLGFEPKEDFEHLVKEARGRRLFPAAPDESLLLKKPSGGLAHGGGVRMEVGSAPYRLLRRWIAQGMPYGEPTDPAMERIEIFPAARTLTRGAAQQLLVTAHYTDGRREDVTALAQFESSGLQLAEVSAVGRVTTHDLTGMAAVTARYQGRVAVFRATIPHGAAVERQPPASSFIDELVLARLIELGVPPSTECDDATFLRRATLDIAGRLPTPAEARAYLADASADKRVRLVDTLLASDDYAIYFANKWSAVLRNKRRGDNYARGTRVFHDWLVDSLRDNVPYDQWVRSLLTATGEMGVSPPVAWYRELKDPNALVEDTAQLFLGLHLQCARCHHHPLENLSQQDYFGLAAFFSRVQRKPGAQPGEERIIYNRRAASAVNPKTQLPVPPTPLGRGPLTISLEDDPRGALADWLTDRENPYFAKALVNRYWKHFLGRGLVEPEDDLRATNPATNDPLLTALAEHFVASGFDLKQLVRTICTSRVYQLSSEPNAENAGDTQNYARYYPRRLPAEVLLDAIDSVSGVKTGFAGLPASVRAVELPDSGVSSYFLTVFGRPESTSACECERSSDANLAQSLHLLNAQSLHTKLSGEKSRPALLAADTHSVRADKVRELYLRAYARPPRPDELDVALAYLARSSNERQAFEDMLWALVNTKEFLFNH